MVTEQAMSRKLQEAYAPSFLRIENESGQHAGPATESHFKLTVVTAAFADMTKVARHRSVYRLLAGELAGPVHALSLHLYTPAEWAARDVPAPASPACRGGSGS